MTVPQPVPGGAATPIARGVVAGIRHALPEHAALFDAGATEFVAALLSGSRPAPGADVFRRAGVAEHASGGDPDRLARAYQAGARRALPILAELGRRVDEGVVGTGVEAVFRCVDVLIRLSTEAFRAAQTPSAAGLRQDLLRDLMTGRPWPALAARAGWTPPERVVAVVVAAGARIAAFHPDMLADLAAEPPYLLLPADADVTRLVGHGPAATGPAVPPVEAATSLRWARRAWELRDRGVLPRDGLVRWPDHLTTHWLLTNELLTSALAARSLAPLDGLSPNQRGKLAETLGATLDARGGAPEVASRLGIHPQTARNRLRRLRTLFGTRLDDPEERLSLRIALRAERVLAGEATPAARTA
ncbi:helix-turn-helix domain-containing protein [Amycolatopsis australiensis]|uniref:PucR C-terminal helix-turn-helix domain-containing protein n=1 Tax=Amycolatopsis australiensis TaxID=546364 RepID=A0A1K1S0N1_9PSEU|nr:helix-turn-helix domain-containing protein [Amycolatopsis australiensis]SFW77899.1 PucR C-terminal helix-turn-helix domain-containing protein [Amycolatopsis australiensis]